jgi:geranylgeranyl pyrophosphate synthase
MALPIAQPRLLPVVKQRKPQDNIPQTRQERDQINRTAQLFINQKQLVPPMPMEELREHAVDMLRNIQMDEKYIEYTAVILNNESWKETLATIPFNRRLLLMPKCLRDESRCPAPFDEFGLLCKQCGLCSIQDLEEEAAKLGYAILVAEGSTIVMKIIETGKIDAIVGISCLNVLEKSFPYMEAAAVPGIAIPLLQDDCADCTVDLDTVWETVHLTSDDKTFRMDLDGLREKVASWFTTETLNSLMGEPADESETIARDWLAGEGKRWRPFLAVCAYQALQDNPEDEIPDDVKRIAIAVECFHKASLIHDDIEDNDHKRYGEKTLHEEHGIPIALNAGDLLIGEGYRMLAQCTGNPTAIARMIETAAVGQRHLCQGQGTELCWSKQPEPLPSSEVLEIFRNKTAPAFEVALRLGAQYANASKEIENVIHAYSESLGIAYQIRDDYDDWQVDGHAPSDTENIRLSVILAMAHERAQGDLKDKIQSVWQGKAEYASIAKEMEELLEETKLLERAERLKDSYKELAIQSLKTLPNLSLKGLLRRVIGKIFNDIQIKGWCSEFEARNAASGETVAERVG